MPPAPAGPPRPGDRDLAVAGVIHDVNQMLTVITGRVELLRLRGEVRAGDLEAIALAARDAAAMLRRLTAGRDEAADEPRADLGRCLDGVAQVHAPPDGAAWSRDAAATGPWILDVDVPGGLVAGVPPQVLREVLGNLVLNAVEAMGRGGRLGVTAGARDGRIRLEVRDSGPGLAPGDRERIFAAGWSTRGDAGRGVGLAASRQLLAAWGGNLEAGEPDGGGAVFVLDLPPAAAAAPAPAAPTPAPLPARILVVDDEAAVREVLAEVLGAWGAAVAVAADAAAAREAWQRGPFALVLVDLTLPGESGLDLARWLRLRRPRPAVVLMTGVDRSGLLPGDAAGTCDAVTTKPLDFAGLKELLARAAAAAARRPDDARAEGSQAP